MFFRCRSPPNSRGRSSLPCRWSPQLPDRGQRAGLVPLDEPGVADNVGRQDGSEPTRRTSQITLRRAGNRRTACPRAGTTPRGRAFRRPGRGRRSRHRGSRESSAISAPGQPPSSPLPAAPLPSRTWWPAQQREVLVSQAQDGLGSGRAPRRGGAFVDEGVTPSGPWHALASAGRAPCRSAGRPGRSPRTATRRRRRRRLAWEPAQPARARSRPPCGSCGRAGSGQAQQLGHVLDRLGGRPAATSHPRAGERVGLGPSLTVPELPGDRVARGQRWSPHPRACRTRRPRPPGRGRCLAGLVMASSASIPLVHHGRGLHQGGERQTRPPPRASRSAARTSTIPRTSSMSPAADRQPRVAAAAQPLELDCLVLLEVGPLELRRGVIRPRTERSPSRMDRAPSCAAPQARPPPRALGLHDELADLLLGHALFGRLA